ncbi:MAG: AI-2E family transporter [Candidatus Promineifilaceae bacterium]
MTTNSPPHLDESPPWGRTTKVVVAITTLLVVALVARRFQTLIAQLVAAAILAYILNPIIAFISRRLKVSRGTAVLLVYFIVLIGLVGGIVALGVAAVEQVSNLINQVPLLIEETSAVISTWMARTDVIVIGPISFTPNTINWDAITNQLLNLVQPVVSQSGQFVTGLASATLRWTGYLLFIYVVSIYIANEIPKVGGYVGDFAQPPGYRKDAERLTKEFGRIWSAYLRGQVILGLVIFFVVWIGLSVLGVRNALALGLLSGLLEFIPVIGPLIGTVTAVIVAFFQQSNYLGLPGWQLALAVLILMIIIQQIENNVLVPKIVGQSLDLHPLVVMVGVFMGSSLAGILGAILAAPVFATLKLLGTYAWRKFFDLPPFPNEPEELPPPRTFRERVKEFVQRWRGENENGEFVNR